MENLQNQLHNINFKMQIWGILAFIELNKIKSVSKVIINYVR